MDFRRLTRRYQISATHNASLSSRLHTSYTAFTSAIEIPSAQKNPVNSNDSLIHSGSENGGFPVLHKALIVTGIIFFTFNCGGLKDKDPPPGYTQSPTTPPMPAEQQNSNVSVLVEPGATIIDAGMGQAVFQDAQTQALPYQDSQAAESYKTETPTIETPTETPTEVSNPPVKGDCCKANKTPGCNDQNTQACVCNSDMNCCEKVWDSFCVTLVRELPCGTCPKPAEELPTQNEEPKESSCCNSHTEPGCDDESVQTCVCELEPSCCQSDWDAFCVILVTTANGDIPACGSCGT